MIGIFIALVLGFSGSEDASPSLELLYGSIPTAWSAQLSQSGSKLAVGCAIAGKRSVCIYDLEAGTSTNIGEIPDDTRLTHFYWANDTHLIFVINRFETSGNWAGRFDFRVDRAISFNTDTQGAAVLMRSDLALQNTSIIDSLELDEPDKVQMSVTWDVDRDRQTNRRVAQTQDFAHVRLSVDLNSGFARRIDEAPRNVIHQVTDVNGEPFVDIIFDDDTSEYKIRRTGTRTILFESVQRTGLPDVWGEIDGKNAIAISFDDENRNGLYSLNLESGELSPFVANGRVFNGHYSVITDRWTNHVIGVNAYIGDFSGQVFFVDNMRSLQDQISHLLNNASVRLLSWNDARSKYVVEARHAGQVAQLYIYDREENSLTTIDYAYSHLASLAQGQVHAFTFTASDGLEVPAYLFLPAGAVLGEQALPLIVHPHGGPQARDDASFDWWAQYFTARGYAVLKPNFRGSDGYGKAFIRAGFGEFGGRMIGDIYEAAAYASAQGWTRADYCVTGSSYGGYAALMVGLEDVEHVRCVIGVSSVTRPAELMGEAAVHDDHMTSAYWAQYMGELFGNDEHHDHISPLARYREYEVPVLLIHGREDTTVPVEQSRQLAQRLRSYDDFKYVEWDGADHYLMSSAVRQSLLQESGAFLDQYYPIDVH